MTDNVDVAALDNAGAEMVRPPSEEAMQLLTLDEMYGNIVAQLVYLGSQLRVAEGEEDHFDLMGLMLNYKSYDDSDVSDVEDGLQVHRDLIMSLAMSSYRWSKTIGEMNKVEFQKMMGEEG